MNFRSSAIVGLAFVVALGALPAASQEEVPDSLRILTGLTFRDIEATGRLFERGIPVGVGSFSPDGFHFAYLHGLRQGLLRRKPERVASLLDLASGESIVMKTDRGRAQRLGGWDETGRYVLIESVQPGFWSSLTGAWTTYHWIFDVVTSRFVKRQPFTGRRDGQRFLWKHPKAYHGVWSPQDEATVWPLYEGELAEAYQEHQRSIATEDNRRLELAEQLSVGTEGPMRELAEVLPRLDNHWTRQGQRDPVVSELFGDRPSLYFGTEGDWTEIFPETEYVAILNHGLALVTVAGGKQWLFSAEHYEAAPLEPLPDGFAELLESRWDRSGGFYHESDPLPRDLQFRRTYDTTGGVGHYFNYVTPNRTHVLLLYSFGPERRILRIVDVPSSWHKAADAPSST